MVYWDVLPHSLADRYQQSADSAALEIEAVGLLEAVLTIT
jgi:hypothetical protein